MKSGDSFGSYRILEPLGAGGMGEVYLAEDSRLGRRVAIKVLPEGVASDPASLARLEQEARLLAQLEHPNVATVFGLEEARPEGGGEPFRHLVMQLAEGEPLSHRIAAGALPIDEALEIARQVAAGVGAAHDKGIIHRDLKPANVMVADGPGGRPAVKVLDFGLAKALEGESDDTARDLTASPTMAAATEAGVIMGTAAYMSPEQARGKPVDRRTDVWAFGCLLHEMLAGQPAFGGETVSDIIAAILTKEPDGSALPVSVPESTRRSLRRCLTRDADARPYDVRDVMLAIDDDAAAVPTAGAGAGAPSARKPGWAIVIVAAAALAVGYLLAGTLSGPAPELDTFAPPERHTQLTYHSGSEAFPGISADGEWLVYASQADGDWDVYLQSVGGDNPINLTEDSDADDWMPSLSPDGRRIAFRSERDGGGIYVMGRTGESVRRLTDAGFNPSWSPDGALLAVTSEGISYTPYARNTVSRLSLVDVATGESHELSTDDAVQAAFSPDGRWIVYWGIAGYDTGQRDLFAVPVEGGDPVPLLDDTATDWTPVFSPDGRSIVFSSDRGGTPGLWRLRFDPSTGHATGAPELVVPGTSHWIAYPSFAADTGQMAYATMDAQVRVHRIVLDDTMRAVVDGPTPLTEGSRNAISPDLSPDGEWLAFYTGEGQQEDLYLQRVDGSVTRRLTSDAFKDRSPRFSPDGRTLAFYASRTGDYQIWAIDIDGSNLRSLTSGNRGNFNYATWSPAGDRLLAISGLGEREAAMIHLDEDPPRLEKLGVETPAGTVFSVSDWSNDGNRLLGTLLDVARGDDFNGAIIYDLTTGASRRITDFGSDHTWLVDDRHIAFNTNEEIWVVDGATGETWRVLSVFPNQILEYMSPLRDRPGVLFSMRRQEDDLWMAE